MNNLKHVMVIRNLVRNIINIHNVNSHMIYYYINTYYTL